MDHFWIEILFELNFNYKICFYTQWTNQWIIFNRIYELDRQRTYRCDIINDISGPIDECDLSKQYTYNHNLLWYVIYENGIFLLFNSYKLNQIEDANEIGYTLQVNSLVTNSYERQKETGTSGMWIYRWWPYVLIIKNIFIIIIFYLYILNFLPIRNVVHLHNVIEIAFKIE